MLSAIPVPIYQRQHKYFAKITIGIYESIYMLGVRGLRTGKESYSLLFIVVEYLQNSSYL